MAETGKSSTRGESQEGPRSFRLSESEHVIRLVMNSTFICVETGPNQMRDVEKISIASVIGRIELCGSNIPLGGL